MTQMLTRFAPFTLAVLTAALVTTSCKKEQEAARVALTVQDTATLRSDRAVALPTILLQTTPKTVQSTCAATLAANGSGSQYLQSATLSAAHLVVTLPSGSNFDFVQEIDVYIKPDEQSPNRVLLAASGPIATGTTSLQLVPQPLALEPYLRNGSYALVADLKLTRPGLNTAEVEAHLSYQVEAQQQ